MSETGILYIASGEEYIREATISAESAKGQMPDIPVAIVTDREVDSSYFDEVIILEEGEWGDDFGDHVFHLDKTPFEKTIKFDTDIYFDGSIKGVFELLDNFDVAAAQAPLRHTTGRISIPELEQVPSAFPEYQGGVIGYSSSTGADSFREEWESAYRSTLKRGNVSNQASLRAALYRSNCRIATLPREYNCLYRMPGAVNGKVKVFHGRLVDVDGKGAPRRVNLEDAIEALNSETGLRAYYRSGTTVKLAEPNLLVEAVDTVRRKGIEYTARRGLELLKKRLSNFRV